MIITCENINFYRKKFNSGCITKVGYFKCFFSIFSFHFGNMDRFLEKITCTRLITPNCSDKTSINSTASMSQLITLEVLYFHKASQNQYPNACLFFFKDTILHKQPVPFLPCL